MSWRYFSLSISLLLFANMMMLYFFRSWEEAVFISLLWLWLTISFWPDTTGHGRANKD